MAAAPDEVEAEYPLFAASADKILSHDPHQKLSLLEFPLRPPWRPYDTQNAEGVRYKPNHGILEMKVPDQNTERGSLELHGKAFSHDSTLCALVKMGDAFCLFAIDEVIQMRPNMGQADAADTQMKAEDDDPDFKPKDIKKATGKASMRAVQVEMQKRETDRQMETRMRSHAHLRERQDAEEWTPLTMSGVSGGEQLLKKACDIMYETFAGKVEMGMSPSEYVDLVSPSTWISQAESMAGAVPAAANAAPATTTVSTLDQDSLEAVKSAMEALFESHSVANASDVRSWLSAYTAKPEARQAALLPERRLHDLLVGGNSIICVRGRYMLRLGGNAATDSFRTLVLELLEQTKGLKKADVMNAAKQNGIEASEHLYNKVMKELCVAQGAVWSLKQGMY